MTDLLSKHPHLETLLAAQGQVTVSADVWSSLLSLASVCVPALARQCVVELIEDGADLRRATVDESQVSAAGMAAAPPVVVENGQPLPTTRALMVSHDDSLVADGLVAIPMLSCAGPQAYVAVLTCHTTSPGEEIRDLLRLLVRHVNTEISNARLSQALQTERSRSANLEIALASNREIGMAMGIIVERSGCTADDAFTTLRRVSQETNRKLRDIAADIVLTGDVPGLDRNIVAGAEGRQTATATEPPAAADVA